MTEPTNGQPPVSFTNEELAELAELNAEQAGPDQPDGAVPGDEIDWVAWLEWAWLLAVLATAVALVSRLAVTQFGAPAPIAVGVTTAVAAVEAWRLKPRRAR